MLHCEANTTNLTWCLRPWHQISNRVPFWKYHALSFFIVIWNGSIDVIKQCCKRHGHSTTWNHRLLRYDSFESVNEINCKFVKYIFDLWSKFANICMIWRGSEYSLLQHKCGATHMAKRDCLMGLDKCSCTSLEMQLPNENLTVNNRWQSL